MTFNEWWKDQPTRFVAASFKDDAREIWESALMAEREACALACDRQAQLQSETGGEDCCIAAANRCARDIRMRDE